MDNHNSILGLREYARRAHAKIRYVPLDKDLRLTHPAPVLRNLSAKRGAKLFAYPAQSNFSGVIHPLKYVQTAHEAGFHVFLDAAAYAPSSKLDLSVVKADFVCVSFYKMFGYPTGIGCLIARRDALGILRRPWFSGGSVAYASVHADAHALHADEAGFEDGTVNFLAASAVTNGLVMLERIGMDAVSRHVRLLGGMLLGCLERFGESVCVYGGGGMDARGGNFAFDVMYKGKRVDARVVEREASERGIALRTGCFCNPGAGEVALGLVGDVKICVGKGREVGEVKRCMGGWVGCVRVSVGIANVERDVEVFEDFLEGFCRRFDESMTVREGKIAEVGGVGRLVATWRKVGGGGW